MQNKIENQVLVEKEDIANGGMPIATTEEMKEQKEISVKVEVNKGLRYGTIKIKDLLEETPKQISTTTNLNHIKNFEDTKFDFGTNILEIFVWRYKEELKKQKVRVKEIRKIKKLLKDKKRLCFISFPYLFRRGSLDKKDIMDIVYFQIKAESPIISVLITKNIKPKIAKEIIAILLVKYRNKIILPFIDLNDIPSHLKDIYLYLQNKKRIPFIAFISRLPSEKNIENFNFIAKRIEDQKIRIALEIQKISSKIRNFSTSMFMYMFGFDLFGFRTIPKPYNAPLDKLMLYKRGQYNFRPLNEFNECKCGAHKGLIPYVVSSDYGKKGKSSIPCSLHDIQEINSDFKDIRKKIIDDLLSLEKLKEKIELEETLSECLKSKTSKK